MKNVCVNGELCDNRGIRVAASRHDNHGTRIVIPCDCIPEHYKAGIATRIVRRTLRNMRERV